MKTKIDYYLATGGKVVPMVYHGQGGSPRGRECGGSTPADSNFCIDCGGDLTGSIAPGHPGNPADDQTTNLASDNDALLLSLFAGPPL